MSESNNKLYKKTQSFEQCFAEQWEYWTHYILGNHAQREVLYKPILECKHCQTTNKSKCGLR